MRSQDVRVFCDAAKDLVLYILVRDTNPESLPHIGRPECWPKPISCKAKTADAPGVRAGLVVSPELVPSMFTARRMEKAMQAWRAFEPILANSARYKVVTDSDSPFFGCVTLDGRFLHGDYDLKAVIIPGKDERRNFGVVETLDGVHHVRGFRVREVMEYINARLGVPMIQHGAAEQYGGHEDELIWRFDPSGEWCRMGLGETVAFYQQLNRPVLDGRAKFASPAAIGDGPLPPNVSRFPGAS